MKDQRERMRELFEDRPDVWVGLPKILDLRIAQYGRLISELRRGVGGRKCMDIKNRTQSVRGEKWSWFMYVPSGDVETEAFV